MVNAAATAVRNATKRVVGTPSVLKWVTRWRSTKGRFNKDPLDFAADNRGILQPQGPNPLVRRRPTVCNLGPTPGSSQGDRQDVRRRGPPAGQALPAWTSFYKQAPRDIPYMTSSGATTLKTVRTIPCHNCGVILPIEFYQVDHHMPQADGDELHILKLLRALGGTTSRPTGAKAAACKANAI